jgi:hypothetical protein
MVASAGRIASNAPAQPPLLHERAGIRSASPCAPSPVHGGVGDYDKARNIDIVNRGSSVRLPTKLPRMGNVRPFVDHQDRLDRPRQGFLLPRWLAVRMHEAKPE